jgi:hypothetical protein
VDGQKHFFGFFKKVIFGFFSAFLDLFLVLKSENPQFIADSVQTWNLAPPRGWADAFFWIFQKSHFWLF